jgi:hypothetical protein
MNIHKVMLIQSIGTYAEYIVTISLGMHVNMHLH